MLSKDIRDPWLDRAAAAGLGLFFLVLYLAFRQGALSYDGAAFVSWFYRGSFFYSHHPVFGYFLHGWIKGLGLVGLRPVHAGLIQSALSMSLCVALFCLFLRQCGIERPIALAVAALSGLNATAFSAATMVETDAISFLVVMANLFAVKRAIERPSRAGDLVLFVSCLLVLAIHMGWCFWVLAIYVTLAWRDRRQLWRAAGRLAEGGATALMMAAVFFLVHLRQGGVVGEEMHFFSMFWEGTSGLGVIDKLFRKPFFNFAAYAGFALYPAGFGLAWAWRFRAGWRTFMVVASVIFLTYYSFWIADEGRFFLPLFPLWGLFAAYGLQGLLSVSGSGAGWVMLALMPLYGALLVLSQRGIQSGWLALGFWSILLGQIAWGWSLARRMGLEGGEVAKAAICSPPRERLRVMGPIFLAVALVACALAYGPQVTHNHQTTPDRLRLEGFRAGAPEGARLATWIEPPHFAYAITLHPTCTPRPDFFYGAKENLENRDKWEGWLGEAAQGAGPALYFDDYSYDLRDFIWSQTDAPQTPLAALRFVRIDYGGFRFYRVEPAED